MWAGVRHESVQALVPAPLSQCKLMRLLQMQQGRLQGLVQLQAVHQAGKAEHLKQGCDEGRRQAVACMYAMFNAKMMRHDESWWVWPVSGACQWGMSVGHVSGACQWGIQVGHVSGAFKWACQWGREATKM